jgi:hypothetical protein
MDQNLDHRFHRFAVGDLVLLDEVVGAVVLKLHRARGIPLYDLRTQAGLIEQNVVSGYLREWPADLPAPSFQALRRL